MINLPFKELKPGMTLSQGVYNASGASYLSRGTSLTPKYIERLRQLGVHDIHVTSISPDVHVPSQEDIVSEKTRAIAIKRVYDAFIQVSKTGTFDINTMSHVSSSIINDIIDRRGNLVQLTDIRVHDLYTFVHCVNVALLSTLIGTLIKLTKKQLSELCIGALLHDLGKLDVPTTILNKPARLTDEEFATVKKHPQTGAQRILASHVPDAATYAIVAQQHHEHMDGTGYPNHLKGNQIHIYGRISAIADVYDALTSARPYKKAYTPAVAYNIMTKCSPGQFDENLLKLFFSNVAIFPVGTVLKTNKGFAIVKSAKFGHTDRPDIVLFTNRDGNILEKSRNICLEKDDAVNIESVIGNMELLHFIHDIGFDPTKYLLDGKE